MEYESSSSTNHSAATSPSISTSHTTVEVAPVDLSSSFDYLIKYIAVGTIVSKEVCNESDDDSANWIELDGNATFSQNLSDILGLPVLSLLRAAWIRVFILTTPQSTTVKIYLLPEDVNRTTVDRSSTKLRTQLRHVLNRLQNEDDGRLGARMDPRARAADDGDRSLWYIFNTVPSPNPDADRPSSHYDREAMQDILQATGPLNGMKTQLYPFQARTTAAMVERETAPDCYLDPRFEERTDQDGRRYYFSPKDAKFMREPQQYETTRCGILAESMGHGKTLICLALIVATKHHMPRFPVEHPPVTSTRECTATLLSMTAASIAHHAIPWKRTIEHPHLVKLLQNYTPSYEIPPDPVRFNRNPSRLPTRKITLSHCTIVVVPDHLSDQWKSQIHIHVQPGVLSILFMDLKTQHLPQPAELTQYDMILFTKSRFELEVLDGQDVQGRSFLQGPQTACRCPYIGASRVRDCTCLTPDEVYKSPLKDVHFLRIIVDEGHGFASASSAAVRVANQLQAERRWVVSGTPAKGLVGVEMENHYHENSDFGNRTTSSDRLQIALKARKDFLNTHDERNGAEAVGLLASRFLKVQPFAGALKGDKAVKWNDYIYRATGKDFRSMGYSSCLSRTLERLVIKTRPEDVERDLQLPPLKHKVVRLQPSFYDKMTNNMFVQVMRGNAITSERADRDYLFHKDNEKPRHELIRNLRQANFFWTGFRSQDVLSSIEVCNAYLDKPEANCAAEDRQALLESMEAIKKLPDIDTWSAMGLSHEMGMYVGPWPEDYLATWALDKREKPASIGLESLYQAQIHVNNSEDPLERFNAVGIDMNIRIQERNEEKDFKRNTKEAGSAQSKEQMLKSGVPPSILTSDGDGTTRMKSLTRRNPQKAKKKASRSLKRSESFNLEDHPSPTTPTKKLKLTLKLSPVATARFTDMVDSAATSTSIPSPSKTRKNVGFATDDLPLRAASSASEYPRTDLPVHQSPSHNILPPKPALKSAMRIPKPTLASPQTTSSAPCTDRNLMQLHASTLLGTTSAKASYLIDKFTQYTPTEKILVFFDCPTTARYIQSLLDLLHIGSRHFAFGMPQKARSRNKTDFQENPTVRVLLIDVRLGGEGLDLNAASIVLIVNPICQPALEAQVVKRAHRIGQTKRVLVETLVLQGTIEEEMFEQSTRMTHTELQQGMARNARMRDVLLNAKIIPVRDDEHEAENAMARLTAPQKIFMREGWKEFNDGDGDEEEKAEKKREKQAKASIKKVVAEEATAEPMPAREQAREQWAGEPSRAAPGARTAQSIFGGPS